MNHCRKVTIDKCSGGGGRGQSAPRDFPPGNFWRLIGKNKARKKGKKKWEMLRKNGKKKDGNKEIFF